jgi:hypothetical protein
VDALTLLDRARQAGLTVRTEGDKLVVQGPKGAAAIAEELLDHKVQVLAALDKRPLHPATSRTDSHGQYAPSQHCPVCKLVMWWQRPPSNGGGWVCGVCHPDPELLLAKWRSQRAQ